MKHLREAKLTLPRFLAQYCDACQPDHASVRPPDHATAPASRPSPDASDVSSPWSPSSSLINVVVHDLSLVIAHDAGIDDSSEPCFASQSLRLRAWAITSFVDRNAPQLRVVHALRPACELLSYRRTDCRRVQLLVVVGCIQWIDSIPEHGPINTELTVELRWSQVVALPPPPPSSPPHPRQRHRLRPRSTVIALRPHRSTPDSSPLLVLPTYSVRHCANVIPPSSFAIIPHPSLLMSYYCEPPYSFAYFVGASVRLHFCSPPSTYSWVFSPFVTTFLLYISLLASYVVCHPSPLLPSRPVLHPSFTLPTLFLVSIFVVLRNIHLSLGPDTMRDTVRE